MDSFYSDSGLHFTMFFSSRIALTAKVWKLALLTSSEFCSRRKCIHQTFLACNSRWQAKTIRLKCLNCFYNLCFQNWFFRPWESAWGVCILIAGLSRLWFCPLVRWICTQPGLGLGTRLAPNRCSTTRLSLRHFAPAGSCCFWGWSAPMSCCTNYQLAPDPVFSSWGSFDFWLRLECSLRLSTDCRFWF